MVAPTPALQCSDWLSDFCCYGTRHTDVLVKQLRTWTEHVESDNTNPHNLKQSHRDPNLQRHHGPLLFDVLLCWCLLGVVLLVASKGILGNIGGY